MYKDQAMAESRQLGPNYCDFIHKIYVNLEYFNNNILNPDLIHKTTSLGFLNLHNIVLKTTLTIPSGRIINLLHRICKVAKVNVIDIAPLF